MDNILENNMKSHKCKCCGIGDIKQRNDICNICGWEDDPVQNKNPEYIGGANDMSLNQYKMFWLDNKTKIMQYSGDRLLLIAELADEYYDKHFKSKNEAYYKSVNPHFDEEQKKIKVNQFKVREKQELKQN